MKGLLLKDIINLKGMAAYYALLCALFTVVSFVSGNVAFLSGIVVIMPLFIVLNAMSFDEKAKWDSYSLTMPISKQSLVLSKYVLAALVTVVCFILSAVISICLKVPILNSVGSSLIISGFSIALTAVALPIMFKLGVEKGRIALILVAVIAFLPLPILSEKLDDFLLNTNVNLQTLLIGFIALASALIIMIFSVFLSCHIYKNKEF